MKNSSSIFDTIRVKPEKTPESAPGQSLCEWSGCESEGSHRAPKGRGREGEFFQFCVKHVREYNKTYNYFQGMDDSQMKNYHKDAATGHRPTWKMGVNRSTMEAQGRRRGEWSNSEQSNQCDNSDETKNGQYPKPKRQRRRLIAAQMHAFETLKLDHDADSMTIKARYKELVKRHHPDANGGDSSFEDRLRQIIQAYNVLKKAGFC